MATWIVHLRIADKFLKNIRHNCRKEFVIGSVSPDCGYGEKDSNGNFNPPPEVTHWAPGGIKKHCRCNDFSKRYLKNKERNPDYYFYLGYYVHLLTDVMWSAMVYMPTRKKYADQYKKNPDYLKTIKQDWYDLDFKFLRENPAFEPYTILKSNRQVKDYLPYYEKGQLSSQVCCIADFYRDFKNYNVDREYPFLNEESVNNFVCCASEIIYYDLNKNTFL